MRMKFVSRLVGLFLGAFSVMASAGLITFTGGTVTLNGGLTRTTNNNVTWADVDYYEEGGFRLDFIVNSTPRDWQSAILSSFVGNWEYESNDIAHGHWAIGGIGDLTEIRVTRLDNTAFSLNYFTLTSNTGIGGGPASGNEQVRIHASIDGTTSSYSQLLPPEDWGFPATQIFVSSHFDNIRAFWFTADNYADCFGMDNFFTSEPAPSVVPEPGTFALLGLGIAGLTLRRRKR